MNVNKPIRQPHPCTDEQPELDNPLFELLRQQQIMLQMKKMPHIELMHFDSDPLMYWRFARAFDTNVKEIDDDSVKLARLMQMCACKASKVVEPCVVMEPNVGHKELLDDMFGNTYIVVDAWTKMVTVGQVISPKDCDGLREFADELRNCGETLKAMWYISEISSQREIVILSKGCQCTYVPGG